MTDKQPAGLSPADAFGVVEQPLSAWERLAGNVVARKLLILLLLALLWEGYARWVNNPLVLPTFLATLESFAGKILSGELLVKAGVSMQVLLKGYAIGLVLALVLSVLAMRRDNSTSTLLGNTCSSSSSSITGILTPRVASICLRYSMPTCSLMWAVIAACIA